MWEGVEAALGRFGFPAVHSQRSDILTELWKQIRLVEAEKGDELLLRLLCAQLFSIGVVEDSLAVWAAKSCSFDTMAGIDVQFMCGAGLEETKQFLRSTATEPSLAALEYLRECEASGDFEEYAVESVLEATREFYSESDVE